MLKLLYKLKCCDELRANINENHPIMSLLLAVISAGYPPEVAIYVHGFNRNDAEAIEEFNRIQTSLNHSNYRIPLIGFSRH
jgi:hypothetical protein